MAYLLNAGLAVSLNGSTWYNLTDHNRQPIAINTILIEKENRMANGTMRKFVVSKKDTISTSWENVPSSSVQAIPFAITSATVTGSNIVYVTSANHNFSTGSIVTISGFVDNKLNITASVISGLTNSFLVSNVKNADDGLTTATASVVEILPSITTVDGNKGASWLESFYNANAGVPIYLKITESKMTTPSAGQVPTDSTFLSAKDTSKTYNVFMTNFNKTTSKRTRTTDYVDMSIEFTEI